MRQGMLQEVGRGSIPAGRAPRLLVFNARHMVVAGIDLGASNLRIALADLDGQVFVSRVLPTPQDDTLAEQVVKATKALQDECLPGTRLANVVIGTPGVVSGNRIRLAPNLPALERPGFLKRLSVGFGCPLEVHNDVNLAAIAETRDAEEVVAFLAIGTGLGASLAKGTAVWSGAQGRAGEVGYLPFPSPVGQTLEDCLSGLGLTRLYRRFGGRGGAEEALSHNDRAARKARGVLLEALGTAVVVLTLAYDPSRIVLGGGVGLHLEPHLSALRRRVRREIPFVVPLQVSSQGELVAQNGAVLLAARRVEQELLA